MRQAPLRVVLLACLAAAPSIQAAPADPCIQCGTIYAVDFSPNFGDTNFWVIDPDAGTATWIGRMDFPTFNDIGISSDGRLYGLSATDDLQLLDACTFPSPGTQVALVSGNSLAGDVDGPEMYLAAAPPLTVYDTVADTTTFRGTFPSNWCDSGGGILTGDLAQSPDPASGLLYGTMSCAGCAGDTLVSIDPSTGDMVDQIGCITDAAGTPYSNVFGLAFDGRCRLFGAVAPAFTPGDASYVLQIDTTTGVATRINLVSTNTNIWGESYNGSNGLASVPCVPCSSSTTTACDPKNHGWWHRECLGADLIDPGRNGGGNGPGPSPRSSSYDVTTFAQADADMAPYGTTACAALDDGPMSDPRVAALRELATIWLNVHAGFLDLTCPVELHPVIATDGLTVADAIAAMQSRLASGTPRDLRDARWIGEHVLNGEALR